ncbi:MAG: nitroreductase family protein [Victivallales bacterium]|nr:nitroreductase family protein [Victivallales bacterium]
MNNPADKIMSLEQAAQWAAFFKASGKVLAVTNGVFDLLHRGHVEYLLQAAQEADGLLIALNSDSSVHELKGPERPIVGEQDRAFLLASLECVSAVVIFDGVRATQVFEAIAPDIYVKGGDYTEDTLDREEYAVLKSAGARFRFIPFIPGKSTTSTIRQIRGETSLPQGSLDDRIQPLLTRRSVRKYQLRPVSDEQIHALLSAAMAAPSACCKDPWHFFVLKSEEIRKKIASVLPNGGFLGEAPCGFVVCGDVSRAHGGELSFALQDCSAAIENLLIAATQMGLGGCWLAVHPRVERVQGIQQILSLEPNRIPVAAVAIGWPAQFPTPRTRYRDDAVTFC